MRRERNDRPSDEDLPRKRPKRGRYVAKACSQCQRRKTKCEGGYPCSACIDKRLECVVLNPENRHSPESSQVARGQPRDQIAVALSNIHRQLVRIVGNDPGMADLHNESDIALDRASLAKSNQPIIDSHDTNQSESAPMAEGFNGEPSIAHLLHEMEGHLQELGMAHPLTATPPTNQPLTPTRGQCRAERNIDCTQVALDAHGIIPNRDKWNILLNTFLNEVHVLYPFLHLPILRSTYEGLCDRLLVPSSAIGEGKNQRMKISQVLFCLATGQCSESSRKETEDGRHSAGWSLFQAGMDILGNPLDVFDDFSISLDGLQAMILAVIYLFRIDANNKTEKLLAIIISHSHQMGLHRRRVTDGMPIFEAEMFRRVWWCTYILDRRLALDTGRPFLIQDVNTDVPLCLEVRESWLSAHQNTHQTYKELKSSIAADIRQNSTTPLSHIAAMVDFSRVVGKVWEAHYCASNQNSSSNALTTEYLEFLVSSAVQKEPSRVWSGSKQPFHVQFAGMEWWQIKQKMLMRIRWNFLKLLIRKSSISMPWLSPGEANADAMRCMQLCRTIILDFNHIPDKYPKHTFPFINYVATATTIALVLIIKQPPFTSIDLSFVSQAARMLRKFCTQTWVSGRIIRAVTKIGQVATLTLGDRTMPTLDHTTSGTPRSSVQQRQSMQNVDTMGPPGVDLGQHLSRSNVHNSSFSNLQAASCEQNGNTQGQNQEHPELFETQPNITISLDTPLSSSSTLEQLAMTDFDFEAGLRQECETNSGWPFLPGFLDPRLSEYRDRPNSIDEELRYSNDLMGDGFNQANHVPFSTPVQSDAAQPTHIRPEYSAGIGDDLLHSLFGSQN